MRNIYTHQKKKQNQRVLARRAATFGVAAVLLAGLIAQLSPLFTPTEALVGDTSWEQITGTPNAAPGDNLGWSTLASSADGTKLIGLVNVYQDTTSKGYIYRSSNSGQTWTEDKSLGAKQWLAAASDASGSNLIIANGEGELYTSNDSGASWTSQTVDYSDPSPLIWFQVASSPDGQKLAASTANNRLYLSSNGGVDWEESEYFGGPAGALVAMSDDASQLLVANPNGVVHSSEDFGETWNILDDVIASYTPWSHAFVTADGTDFTLVSNDKRVFHSSDSGATWTEAPVTAPGLVYSIAHGQKLLSVDTSNDIYVSDNFGTSWTKIFTSLPAWNTHAGITSVASNEDGTKLVLSVGTGSIYSSTNSGTSWTELTVQASRSWNAIASSADGQKLVAAANPGFIYTSSDGGETWTMRPGAGMRAWVAITSSEDGTRLAAITSLGGGDYVYTSSDSGVTWNEQTNAGTFSFASIASNADGTRLIAAVTGGSIYISTNSGVSWTENIAAGTNSWYAIASSDDGMKLAASSLGDTIYTSSDGGASWTPNAQISGKLFASIASNGDGTKLVAGEYGGLIYTSSDSGATWTPQSDSGTRTWWRVFMSKDGNTILATDSVTQPGSIYSSVDGGVSWVEQTSTGAHRGTFLAANETATRAYISTNGGPIFAINIEQPSLAIKVDDSTVLALTATRSDSPQEVEIAQPTFTGRAFKQSEVNIEISDKTCSTDADMQGDWECPLTEQLEAGKHSIEVSITNPESDVTVNLKTRYITVNADGSIDDGDDDTDQEETPNNNDNNGGTKTDTNKNTTQTKNNLIRWSQGLGSGNGASDDEDVATTDPTEEETPTNSENVSDQTPDTIRDEEEAEADNPRDAFVQVLLWGGIPLIVIGGVIWGTAAMRNRQQP